MAAIEAIAQGRAPVAEEEAHLSSCGVCQTALEELQAQARTHTRLRMALGAPADSAYGTDLPEDLIPGYRLLEEINRGSQGVVYKAVQERTKRTVAVKMLLGGAFATERQRARFEREVEIIAGLNHPGIVTIYDRTPVRGDRYAYAMEYIEGSVPLNAWRPAPDAGPRAGERATLVLFAEICDAVNYAQQRGVIHRDLKPANILIDAAGKPHILDFGIAKATGADLSNRTLTVEFAGTLAYASPEQIGGRPDDIDARTDVYSLGVILFQMLSGRLPHRLDDRSIAEAARIVTQEDAPRLAEIDRSLRGDLDMIVAKALERDVARRYQSAGALAADVRRHLTGRTIEARRDSTWYVMRKTAARHRVVFTAAGLIIVLLGAFGAAMGWQAHRLQVRGRELAGALSDSNIERGRMLAAAGNNSLASDVLWPELIGAGVTRIDSPASGFDWSPGALRAYWALWDTFRRSSCLATLRTRGKGIELLYFDEGGARLSALDSDGNLTSWSVATWEQVRDTRLVAPIDGASEPGFQAALAPGGNIAVFGAGLLRVFDAGTGALAAQVDDPEGQALTGAFSPDGTLLATIGRDKRLRIRDARTLETTVTMAESIVYRPRPWFSRPTFSLDGRLVAADRPGELVGLWNTASGVLERTLRPPDSLALSDRTEVVACSIAFGPDGTIAASLDNHVVVWPTDGSPALDLGAPFGVIRSVVFLPGSEGRMLVSSGCTPGGGGGATIIWNLATGKRVATFKHPEEMFACDISPDARLIAVGCEFGAVRVYEAAAEPHIAVLRPANGRGSIVALSPDGKTVALAEIPDGKTGNDVLLIDLKSGSTIGKFHEEGSFVGLAFAPDGSSLFGCEERGRTIQWELPSGTTRRKFAFADPAGRRAQPGRAGEYTLDGFNQMRLSPDGSLLARARDDGLIGLWDVPSGRWVDWLDSGSTDTAVIDFSPDGRTLVARHPESCVLWDVRTRQPQRTIATARGYPTVRFCSKGSVIAYGVRGRIQFFDAGTGRILSENKDPRSAGMGIVFHPGGSVCFASAFDSSIRLWDPRTGRELLSLQKHTTLIHSLLLTPDGNTLISADSSGTVLVWDLRYYNEHIRRELQYRVSTER